MPSEFDSHLNPYAASARPDLQHPVLSVSDQDEIARERIVLMARMRAITYDANLLTWLCPLACVCSPMWAMMLPWFAYRLQSWYRLRAAYPEIESTRIPSQPGQLAARFVAARPKLIAGVALGSVYWLLIIASLLVRLTQP